VLFLAFLRPVACCGAPALATGPAAAGTFRRCRGFADTKHLSPEGKMGRYALLWLLGVPIPILLLIYLFGGLH
jgi:hypothetical protein